MDNNNISTQKDESHLVKNDSDEYRFRRYLSQVITNIYLSREKKNVNEKYSETQFNRVNNEFRFSFSLFFVCHRF